MYLVDWDLPTNPSRHRTMFYRKKNKLLDNGNGRVKYSSMSVLITNDESLAQEIHQLARECNARATHVYQINGEWKEVAKYES